MLALKSDSPRQPLSFSPPETLVSESFSSGGTPPEHKKRSSVFRRCHKKLFPCVGLKRACPCMPSRLTAIQDWLHLMLVVGVFGCLICLGLIVYEVFVVQNCSEFCYKRLIAIAVFPTTFYFMETIRGYDEELTKKKKRKEQEADNLTQEYNKQVDEITEQRNNIVNHCHIHAGRAFQDKSKDFIKFLKRLKKHNAHHYVETDALDELKVFVKKWLVNYSKKLINEAEDNFILKGLENELERCKTPGEVCDVAIKRQNEWSVHIQIAAPPPRATNTSRKCVLTSMEEGDARIATCGISWLRLQTCPKTCVTWKRDEEVPLTLRVCCATLEILSKMHAYLIVSFLIDIFLLVLEASWGRWCTFTLVLFNELCIVSTLACFEDVNEIARLEVEIRYLKSRSEDVAKRREEANRMWELVQDRNDLWQYWALPTLTFMKTFHEHLADLDDDEDVKPEQRMQFLKDANSSLDSLHVQLEEEWKKEERNSSEWREHIGHLLISVEREAGAEMLLAQLPVLNLNLPDKAPLTGSPRLT